MVSFFVNDLSIDGTFSDTETFCAECIEPLLRFRAQNPNAIRCSRSLHLRPVTSNDDLRGAVMKHANRDFKHRVLSWLSKNGPFWDDERTDNPDDLFYLGEEDVTDQGLGEATRRRVILGDARSFSFGQNWAANDLSIIHGLLEEPIGTVSVPNTTDLQSVLDAINGTRRPPMNWDEVMTLARESCPGLVFADDCAEPLEPVPFGSYQAERILVLLGILQKVLDSLDDDGNFSDETMKILADHFSGEKALFTDESTTNKARFRDQLTFRDPKNEGETLFCPWHGKIKTPQLRIHFDWPPRESLKEIVVVYIGPKITKT